MAVLSKANYVTWMAQVEDHIGAIDHEDAMTIWDDFVWKKDPEKDDDDSDNEDPIDRDWQLSNSAPTKKRRLMHNKLWSHLRKHLDTEMFQSSLRVKTKSVPLLLRHIRDKWHKHSPADRAKLKDKLNAMKVSDYANMELYGESFMTLIEIMRNYDIGMANSEEDCIYAFEQGIPVEWDTYKAIRRANFDNLKGTIDHYVAVSKSNPNLIGSVGNDKQPDKAFATTTTTSTELVCRRKVFQNQLQIQTRWTTWTKQIPNKYAWLPRKLLQLWAVWPQQGPLYQPSAATAAGTASHTTTTTTTASTRRTISGQLNHHQR